MSRKRAAILFAFTILCLLWPFASVLLLAAVLATYCNRKLNCGWLTAAVISVLSVFCIIMIISVFLGLAFTNGQYFLIIHLALTAAAIAATVHIQPRPSIHLTSIHRHITPFVISSIMLALLVILPFGAIRNSTQALASIYNGEDNSAHIGMLVYAYNHQGGAYNDNSPGIIHRLQTYPQGSHTTLAYTAWALNPYSSIKKTAAFIWLYLIAVIGFAVSILILIGSILARFSRHRHVFAFHILCGALLYVFVIRHIIDYGFYTQLTSFAFLAASLILSLWHPKPLLDSRIQTILLLTLSAALSSTWYMLVFVSGLAALPALIRNLRRDPIFTVIVGVIASVVILYPIFLNFSDVSKTNPILSGGAIYAYTQPEQVLLFGGIAILTMLFIYVAIKFRLQTIAQLSLWLFAAASLLLVAGIYLYLLMHGMTTSYYYIKVCYLLMAVSLVGIVIIAAIVSPNLTSNKNVKHQLLYGGLIIIIAGGILYSQGIIRRPVTPTMPLPASFIATLNQAQATGSDFVVAGGPCNAFTSYLATKWAGMLLNSYTPERDAVGIQPVYELQGNVDIKAKQQLTNYAARKGALLIDLDTTSPCN